MSHPSITTGRDLEQFRADARQRYDAFAARGVKLNLTRGKPSARQLDLSNDLLSMPGPGDYKAGAIDCRNYGDLQGIPELRALLAPVFGVTADRTIVCDNGSLPLMHEAVVSSLLNGASDSPRPWGQESKIKFICAVPGYDRHFGMCEDLGIELVSVALTDEGPDMDAVERLVAADPLIKAMWCVPKYSNPSGAVYSPDTIQRLARMKTAAPDFRLFWDNAYAVHHLTPERVEIDNLDEACARAGHPHRAFIFGSTSKMTFAGAGVGLFAGSTENVAWFMKRLGMRTIGGDKINQLRHVRLLKNAAGIDALMDRHRAIMAPKFEKVLEVFDAHLAPAGIGRWTRPKGGYFITLDLPDGTAKRVVQLAREAGVELTPAGATHPYGKDPQDRTIRIAPSFPELAEVARWKGRRIGPVRGLEASRT